MIVKKKHIHTHTKKMVRLCVTIIYTFDLYPLHHFMIFGQKYLQDLQGPRGPSRLQADSEDVCCRNSCGNSWGTISWSPGTAGTAGASFADGFLNRNQWETPMISALFKCDFEAKDGKKYRTLRYLGYTRMKWLTLIDGELRSETIWNQHSGTAKGKLSPSTLLGSTLNPLAAGYS